MNNILGLNLIIINAHVGAVSICRGLSEGLRGTELGSLENVPESVSSRHLLRYLESLPEALTDNLFIREHSDIVTGQDRVGAGLKQQPALCCRPAAVGEDCVEELDGIGETLSTDLLYFLALQLRRHQVSHQLLCSLEVS